MQHTSRSLHYALNPVHSSCAHWLASASATQRHPTWLTCVSLCRRCPVAPICVLPFTVTSSFRGLAWPAVGLVVSPSRSGELEQSATWSSRHVYPLPVSSTNLRLNCSSGHITWDHSTFVIVYYKRGQKLTLTHYIVLYLSHARRRTEHLTTFRFSGDVTHMVIWPNNF